MEKRVSTQHFRKPLGEDGAPEINSVEKTRQRVRRRSTGALQLRERPDKQWRNPQSTGPPWPGSEETSRTRVRPGQAVMGRHDSGSRWLISKDNLRIRVRLGKAVVTTPGYSAVSDFEKVSGANLRSTTAKKVCSYCEGPISYRSHEPINKRHILVQQKQLRSDLGALELLFSSEFIGHTMIHLPHLFKLFPALADARP
ncbi:hypothetical protein Y032_0037g3384 [Ancylostoma ceylanicum]|nr:hypothetical protein Y032_0037g3384 [Ancylostoma ceylanicum]